MRKRKKETYISQAFEDSSGLTVRDGKIYDDDGVCLGDYSDRDAMIFLHMVCGSNTYDGAAALYDKGPIPDEDLWRYEILSGY